jgi:hypothetical protein
MINYLKIFFITAVITILFFSISCTIKADSKDSVIQSSASSIAQSATSDIVQSTTSTTFKSSNDNSESIAETSSSEGVPLPTPEDIVRLFFNLINEKRIPEAIALMTDQMAGDDSLKQMWGVQFNAIQSIEVKSIEPYSEEQWTESEKMFKVVLDVSVSPEAKDEPIPYYGWDSNPSIRWVSIKKNATGLWEIDSLATGP